MIFIDNHDFMCENWVGMPQEWSRIYLEVISHLQTTSESQSWIPKLGVSTREPGNIARRIILITWEPGDTGHLLRSTHCVPGNTAKGTILTAILSSFLTAMFRERIHSGNMLLET